MLYTLILHRPIDGYIPSVLLLLTLVVIVAVFIIVNYCILQETNEQ